MKKNWFLNCAWCHAHSYAVYKLRACLYGNTLCRYGFFFCKGIVKCSNQRIFYCPTNQSKRKLKMTSCILQIKTGSVWVDSMTLTAPSKVATNTSRYSAAKDYSSSCSSGNTYRIKAVFDADGHTKTAYSNSISY